MDGPDPAGVSPQVPQLTVQADVENTANTTTSSMDDPFVGNDNNLDERTPILGVGGGRQDPECLRMFSGHGSVDGGVGSKIGVIGDSTQRN